MNISIPKISERTFAASAAKEIFKGFIVIALARMQIFGMSPLGLAFASTFMPHNAYIAFIGLCFGAANLGRRALGYILTFFIYYMLIHIKKIPALWQRAVLLGISTIFSFGIPMVCTGINTAGVLMVLSEAVLVGSFHLLFAFWDGKGAVANLAQIIIFGGVLNGISGAIIPYVNVSLAAFCGIFSALCFAYSCQLPLAALSSGILAFVMTLGNRDAIQFFGAFSICGAMGAALSGYGKIGVGAGFLCGICISVLYDGTLGNVGVFDLFVPILVFELLPEHIHYRISGFINSRFMADIQEETCPEQKIVHRLKTMASAVCDLAEGVKVTGRIEDKNKAKIFEQVSSRVCVGCSMAETCQKRKHNEIETEILKTIETDGYCDLSNMPVGFGQFCLRAERFLSEFSHIYELYKQNIILSGVAESSRSIMAMQYSEISNVIDLLSCEINGQEKDDEERRVLAPKITVRRETKPGQSGSGDTVIYFERGRKFFVVLCDGMGSGDDAMHQSRLTARLFEKFLKAGFDKETSLRMINSALALKADQESFSTVDILEIDTKTGDCEFLKVGSAQSFVKKKKEIGVISSKSLPVGILENVEVAPVKCQVEQGDIILMVTDGISEAASGVLKSDWIKKLLALEKRTPRELADLILCGAKARTKFCDDMTCCVIKIEKRKEE